MSRPKPNLVEGAKSLSLTWWKEQSSISMPEPGRRMLVFFTLDRVRVRVRVR